MNKQDQIIKMLRQNDTYKRITKTLHCSTRDVKLAKIALEEQREHDLILKKEQEKRVRSMVATLPKTTKRRPKTTNPPEAVKFACRQWLRIRKTRYEKNPLGSEALMAKEITMWLEGV